MAFCFDNAEYAAALARKLASSLGDKGLPTEAALARLYVVSDVLSNCAGDHAKRRGAAQYVASFGNLLPEAFETAGREWFRRILDFAERNQTEDRVRCVLAALRSTGAFPPNFTRGLEALLFAPVIEDASEMPDTGADELLRAKLSRWFSVANQARLPYACRLRGLSSKALPTAACRARLVHFERYWHIPGVSLPEDPDLFGGAGDWPSFAPLAAAEAAEDSDADSCDGERLSWAELAELGLSP
uniref:CID domain-containing protein n=1 Tax=Alexandrium catenella TaxID=2925 RepID=A0A7S1WV15_ALECA